MELSDLLLKEIRMSGAKASACRFVERALRYALVESMQYGDNHFFGDNEHLEFERLRMEYQRELINKFTVELEKEHAHHYFNYNMACSDYNGGEDKND
jgi:hypothetical protein